MEEAEEKIAEQEYETGALCSQHGGNESERH